MPGEEAKSMRIATWNVERPKPRGWKVPPAQRALMAEVGADVWVLTETHLDHTPSDEHHHRVFSPVHPERRPDHERWASIWSRWPLEPLEDFPGHPRGTVAARVQTPAGPVIVYATVIPWANERHYDDGTPAKMWQVHLAELARQGAEWRALRSRYPGVPLVVAGDFNQNLDGSRWYGTAATRAMLTTALSEAGLTCLTGFDVIAAGMLRSHHLVDHVCVTDELVPGACVSCREPEGPDGRAISDHPVVIADLRP